MAETINVYMDDKTKALIEKIAERERRSVSGQIMFIVEKWLEDND